MNLVETLNELSLALEEVGFSINSDDDHMKKIKSDANNEPLLLKMCPHADQNLYLEERNMEVSLETYTEKKRLILITMELCKIKNINHIIDLLIIIHNLFWKKTVDINIYSLDYGIREIDIGNKAFELEFREDGKHVIRRKIFKK